MTIIEESANKTLDDKFWGVSDSNPADAIQ